MLDDRDNNGYFDFGYREKMRNSIFPTDGNSLVEEEEEKEEELQLLIDCILADQST